MLCFHLSIWQDHESWPFSLAVVNLREQQQFFTKKITKNYDINSHGLFVCIKRFLISLSLDLSVHLSLLFLVQYLFFFSMNRLLMKIYRNKAFIFPEKPKADLKLTYLFKSHPALVEHQYSKTIKFKELNVDGYCLILYWNSDLLCLTSIYGTKLDIKFFSFFSVLKNFTDLYPFNVNNIKSVLLFIKIRIKWIAFRHSDRLI